MASTIQVDKIQDTGGNTILSSNSTGTFTYEAASGANFTALDADNVSAGTLAVARGGTGTTSYSPGITEADMWRITADQTNPSGDITANWERVDTDGFAVLGSGLSESSGIFTFPSTGYWNITAYSKWNNPSADERYITFPIYTTLDNASYDEAAGGTGNCSGGSSTRNGGAISNFIFDVTSTTNCKFKVQGHCSDSSTVLQGDSGRCETYVSVIRLGDT